MGQAIRCKRCEEEIIDLDSGLCFECETILELEHNQIDVRTQCIHENDKDDCKLCEYEFADYIRQVQFDYTRGVMG